MYLMSDVVTVVKRVISPQGGTEINKTKLQEQITFRKYMLLFSPDIFTLCFLSENVHKNTNWKLPIMEPQGTEMYFLSSKVPFNRFTGNLDPRNKRSSGT